MQNEGYSLLLLSGMLDYFELTNVSEASKAITIYLEEKNNIGTESCRVKYESKGFYPAVQVNNFPVRGKRLLLEIRRRRWINKETGEYIDRDFHLVADGARMIQEFAAFLKGLRGQSCDKL